MDLAVSKYLDKKLRKRHITKSMVERFFRSFQVIAQTEQLNVFDIKKLKTNKGDYFRLRIGNYRGIFKIEGNVLVIEDIEVRGDVYKQWARNQ